MRVQLLEGPAQGALSGSARRDRGHERASHDVYHVGPPCVTTSGASCAAPEAQSYRRRVRAGSGRVSTVPWLRWFPRTPFWVSEQRHRLHRPKKFESDHRPRAVPTSLEPSIVPTAITPRRPPADAKGQHVRGPPPCLDLRASCAQQRSGRRRQIPAASAASIPRA